MIHKTIVNAALAEIIVKELGQEHFDANFEMVKPISEPAFDLRVKDCIINARQPIKHQRPFKKGRKY